MTNTNLLKPWFYNWHNLKSKKSFPTGRGIYFTDIIHYFYCAVEANDLESGVWFKAYYLQLGVLYCHIPLFTHLTQVWWRPGVTAAWLGHIEDRWILLWTLFSNI